MEVWKDIKGFEGLYQVSTMGRVRSFHKYGGVEQRILRIKKSKCGYMTVILSKNGKGKTLLVHRLVAQAFISNPKSERFVNHKDEDKTNNQVDNLEWCSAEHNNTYGTRNQRAIESKKKRVLCVETGRIFESLKSATEITRATGIHKVAKGKQLTSGGYHWRYV